MLDRRQGLFTCDHVKLSDDPEEQERLVAERTIRVPPLWPAPGEACPFCGHCVSLKHFTGRCMAGRKARRAHEAKRSREDRMRERGFRQDLHMASVLNPMRLTRAERNAAKRARKAR